MDRDRGQDRVFIKDLGWNLDGDKVGFSTKLWIKGQISRRESKLGSGFETGIEILDTKF